MLLLVEKLSTIFFSVKTSKFPILLIMVPFTIDQEPPANPGGSERYRHAIIYEFHRSIVRYSTVFHLDQILWI